MYPVHFLFPGCKKNIQGSLRTVSAAPSSGARGSGMPKLVCRARSCSARCDDIESVRRETCRAEGRGGPVGEIRPGGVGRVPAGGKAWAGRRAATGITPIAIPEEPDGKVLEWPEKVSDEQYKAAR